METVKLLALVMIVSTMLTAGLQVNLARLRDVFSNYALIGKGLLLNFILLPAFAFLLVRVFGVQTDVAIGIMLMAMAPGVPFLVNSAGRKQGGSLEFVLAIAFAFSALSVVTIPITAQLVLPADSLARMPAQNFFTTLIAFQLVPLVLGALLSGRLKEPVVEKTVKLLHIAFLAASLVLVVLLTPKLIGSISAVYGFGQLAIIAVIGLFAVGMGWLFGGPDREFRRTLSIGSLMRNVGLCSLIGSGSFADTLVLPAIIAYFFVTFVISLPVRIYYSKAVRAATTA